MNKQHGDNRHTGIRQSSNRKHAAARDDTTGSKMATINTARGKLAPCKKQQLATS